MAQVDEKLLLDALACFTRRRPVTLDARELPINPGSSGVSVRRFEAATGSEPLRLVTKPCGLAERRTLNALDGLAAVPRAFVPDAGETLPGFDPDAQRRAAEALAEVHARFLGRRRELAWLPELERSYVNEFIVAWCWRRTWDGALEDEQFITMFGDRVGAVERSVRPLAAGLLAFAARAEVDTLAHTDVYYGHVFEQAGRALVIDWGQARYAPLFLDLGNTFDTPEGARRYREALAGWGVRLDDGVFRDGHLLARCFAGVRYLWWLASWRAEPQGWKQRGARAHAGHGGGQTVSSVSTSP